jgi:apolipoprotein N-acyltransferase
MEILLVKIRHHFNTLELTKGFGIALLSSAFIYLNACGFCYPLVDTILGLTALYFLLKSHAKIWFYFGGFVGLFWFWWIPLSFKHYDMTWASPIGASVIMLTYALLLGTMAWGSEKIPRWLHLSDPIFSLALKGFSLWIVSFIHPFTFDWFKPELMFVDSYFGVEKWRFLIILTAIVFALWKEKLVYLLLALLSYQPNTAIMTQPPNTIALVRTDTPIEIKWDTFFQRIQLDTIFKEIDTAIQKKQHLIVFPESVFPLFLNLEPKLLGQLQERASKIAIVTGGLYWDGTTAHNTTYIFTQDQMTVANKVVLVPFGESNPLPHFLSEWVNQIFFDGAVDYEASSNVTDYEINGVSYRNAICFEATSERLYDGEPENMIVLSNNGWFTPSIEPTLQKLLLQYYSRKYGTTIYHAVNMSEVYMIQNQPKGN